MKRSIYIAFLLIFCTAGSCSDDISGSTEGCWTGIYKGTSERAFITCCDYDTYKDGAVGDYEAAADYSSWKFETISCSKCMDKYGWGGQNNP